MRVRRELIGLRNRSMDLVPGNVSYFDGYPFIQCLFL